MLKARVITTALRTGMQGLCEKSVRLGQLFSSNFARGTYIAIVTYERSNAQSEISRGSHARRRSKSATFSIEYEL